MSVSRRRFVTGLGACASMPLLASCGGPGKTPTAGVPAGPFDEDSTAEDVTQGIDLNGKIAVVTGCTSGIGYETMRVLALRGAWVIGTSRSQERAAEACSSVIGTTIPLELELADPKSVVECAEEIRALLKPIDMLICNAGFRGGGNDRELVNGVEKHFATNHLGHFLLVNRLLDRLFFSWQGRVVIVASRTSYTDAPSEGIRFDDLALAGDYSDALAYGHSKLANVLHGLGLARRLRGTRITANSLHPGVIDTEIDRNLNPVLQLGFGVLTAFSGKSVEQGAATSCYVATHPELGATSGDYFEDCNAVTVAGAHHYNEAMSDRLWEVSEELMADYIVIHERRPEWDELDRQRRERLQDPEAFEQGGSGAT